MNRIYFLNTVFGGDILGMGAMCEPILLNKIAVGFVSEKEEAH